VPPLVVQEYLGSDRIRDRSTHLGWYRSRL
jgi:hypothetical protein